ncbi:MAG: tRNA 4-thiouridine(8) synthase ThiI [Ruminococcaceae bacterium]|nr:tRNA 4-thiouridine(8) synthase ThiI [Oscillospiraceae bacterium]
MDRVLLVRYGEIILKGQNRPIFEDALVRNIRYRLRNEGAYKIYKSQATIYIEPAEGDEQTDAIYQKLKKIFGIVSIVVAYKTEKSMDGIFSVIPEAIGDVLKNAKTFKVEAKRSDKKFPLKSPEICDEVGGFILDNYPHIKVDVHNPEVVVHAEIRDDNAFVHTGREKGIGGMPVGTGGKAALLLSGGIDSPVAAYMIAKRGVALEAVHFFSYPYTSDRAKDKVLKLAGIVSEYTGKMKVHVVPFTEIQLQIRDKCPEEYLTLIMRRFMMAISERIARLNGCDALVTGESLGQVASQTILALGVTNDAVNMPVFRPLIGMDKTDIVDIAREIGTFDTSILPYEDCCTVFTPKRPSTKPRLEKVLKYQALLDCEALIDEAVAGVETIIV